MNEKIFSIPTEYKGIKFRSRLEAEVAMFFDDTKIKWQFEPQSFLLNNSVHYMPDFFLPEMKMWVEVKGEDRREIFINGEQCKGFIKLLENRMQKETLLIISHAHIDIFDRWPLLNHLTCEELNTVHLERSDEVWYFRCRDCGKISIHDECCSWACKCCGSYDGKHHRTQPDGPLWEEWQYWRNLYDFPVCKGWLDAFEKRRLSWL